jgi:hypothetical protein
MYELVTGEIDPPDEEDGPEVWATWEDVNRSAMRILVTSIVEPEFQLIRNCNSAREIWETLESNFRDVSMLRQCNTFEQMISLKYQPDKTIHDHITAFNKLYQEIKTFEHFRDLPDAIWVTRFLRSLPQDYAPFARSYDKELQTTKLNDVYGHLRSEFNNRASPGAAKEPQTPATANYASATSGKKSKKPFKGKGASTSTPTTTNSSSTDGCGYCHRAGHDRDNCHALKMKLFYELHNSSLNSKKPPPSKGMTFSFKNIATYESEYCTLSSEFISSAMISNSSFDI